MQALKLNKNYNDSLRYDNLKLFKHYLHEYDCLCANNKKFWFALFHRGLFFKKDGYYHALIQITRDNSVPLPQSLDVIKVANSKSLLNPEELPVIHILNYYYAPIIYNLGDATTIDPCIFDRVNSLTPVEVEQIQNYVIQNSHLFRYIDMSTFFKPHNALDILKIYNKENLNFKEE